MGLWRPRFYLAATEYNTDIISYASYQIRYSLEQHTDNLLASQSPLSSSISPPQAKGELLFKGLPERALLLSLLFSLSVGTCSLNPPVPAQRLTSLALGHRCGSARSQLHVSLD
jgi:hypothetical protein